MNNDLVKKISRCYCKLLHEPQELVHHQFIVNLHNKPIFFPFDIPYGPDSVFCQHLHETETSKIELPVQQIP